MGLGMQCQDSKSVGCRLEIGECDGFPCCAGRGRFFGFAGYVSAWGGLLHVGWGCRGSGFGFGGAVEGFEEAGDEAISGWGVGVGELGAGGDGAEGGIGGDVFDGSSLLCQDGCGPGEVERGDLEAVEEEAGAAGVELIAGEAVEDLADGLLDGGAVFGDGEGEGCGVVLALGEVDGGEGLAGVEAAVVEAEVLVAEGGAAAAVAAGEDVAALEAACGRGDDVGLRHDVVPLPPGTFCKVFG